MTTLILCGEPFYIKFCRQTKRFLRLRVCSTLTSIISGQWAFIMLSGIVYYFLFVVNIWACRFGKFVVGTYFPPDQRQHNFLEQFF